MLSKTDKCCSNLLGTGASVEENQPLPKPLVRREGEEKKFLTFLFSHLLMSCMCLPSVNPHLAQTEGKKAQVMQFVEVSFLGGREQGREKWIMDLGVEESKRNNQHSYIGEDFSARFFKVFPLRSIMLSPGFFQ